jgi:uncharacterized OB-fold protein
MLRGKPVREDLFTVNDSGGVALIGGYCRVCSRRAFPYNEFCPYCGGRSIEKVTLSQRGILELCTVVRRPPPGYEGPVPYGLGVVHLPEGIAVVAPIVTRERLPSGTPVECTTLQAGTDESGQALLTYAFAPVDANGAHQGRTEARSEHDA